MEATSLEMGNSGKIFSVRWFDPRNGGDLQHGTVKSISATGLVALGYPPNEKTKDWVVLIRSEK